MIDTRNGLASRIFTNECVKPSDDGKTPFPTGDISALKPITFGAKVCPPEGGKE